MKEIGRRKYEALKQFDLDSLSDETLASFNATFPNLTVADAIKSIADYETKNPQRDEKHMAKKVGEYFDGIGKETPKQAAPSLTKEILWRLFVQQYRSDNRFPYSQEPDSIENLKPLIFYFIGDMEGFGSCRAVSKESEPSSSKGLLIIGGYGNGKTSIMKALEVCMGKTDFPFRLYSTNQCVDMFEACQTPYHKEEFWSNMLSGTICFDDLLTEREASNYGKLNLLRDILERRYERGKRTYITMNFKDGTDNNLSQGLAQIGERYGSRLYDRIFAMFNIIEFTGKSHRK